MSDTTIYKRGSAVEQMWHIYNSQGQSLTLAVRQESFKSFGSPPPGSGGPKKGGGGLMVLGSGLGFRVQDSGFRFQGSGFRVQGSGFRVQGSGCMVQDLKGADERPMHLQILRQTPLKLSS